MSTPLFDAVTALEQALIYADTLGRAFDAAGEGAEVAPWVYMYQGQIAAINEAFSRVNDAAFAANWGEPTP